MSSSTDDERFERQIRAVIGRAGADAPPVDALDVASTAGADRAGPGRRGWILASAAALMCIVIGIAWLTIGRDRSELSPGTPTSAEPPIAAAETPTTPSTTTPSTTTAPSTTGDGLLTRPVIDTPACLLSRTVDAYTNNYRNPFARSLGPDGATQVFTDPSGDPGLPFIVVQRYFGERRDQHLAAPGRLTENPVTGRSSASFHAADGSEVYVNSHDLTLDQLRGVALALVARPAGAAVPGFDLGEGDFPPLVLRDEAVGELTLEFHATSRCLPPRGSSIAVHLVGGRPVAQYALVLDHPEPRSTQRRQADGTMLIVWGPNKLVPLPTVDDIIEAPEDLWGEHLSG